MFIILYHSGRVILHIFRFWNKNTFGCNFHFYAEETITTLRMNRQLKSFFMETNVDIFSDLEKLMVSKENEVHL